MNQVKLSLIILAVFLIASPGMELNAKKENGIGILIDNYIKSFPYYENFSGSVLVADRDQILFQKGYGLARIDGTYPNTVYTGYQIGSISKAFTAMIALKLAQQGLLDLDKKITDYLSYYPAEPGSRITVRQLLSNTSGVPHHFQVIPDYFRSHDHYFHFPRELLRLFWSAPLRHEPGTRFTYSSPGYYIVGAILQQVTKKNLNELLQELICIPLGMKETYIENNLSAGRNLAEGYQRGISGLVRAYREDKSTALGAGDIVSTAYDLFLWQRSLNLREDKLLESRSKRILFAPVVEGSPITMAGPHFEVPYEGGMKKLAVSILNGTSSGYSCCLNRQTELDRCVIVLSNINGEDATRIADNIGDIVLRHRYQIAIGDEAPLTRTLPQGTSIDPKAWRSVFGLYRATPGSYIGILFCRGRAFYLDYHRDSGIGNLMELVPQSGSEFLMGYDRSFACRFDDRQNGAFMNCKASRKGRVFQKGERVTSSKSDAAEYRGYFSSRELQVTVQIHPNGEALVAQGHPFGKDEVLTFLEKDLFASAMTGILRFRRDTEGVIAGFDLFNAEYDRFFGSQFERVAD